MGLVVVVLLGALVLGVLRGGRLSRLGELRLRTPRLVGTALAVQLIGTAVGGPAHAVGLALSAALVVLFLVRNRGLRGTGLVALGLASNALVVALNGAMPVSRAAAARAGMSPATTEEDTRHELETATTRLRELGDVVPLPLPWRREVVSVGDLLLAAGVAGLVGAGLGVGRRPAPRPARATEAGRGSSEVRPFATRTADPCSEAGPGNPRTDCATLDTGDRRRTDGQEGPQAARTQEEQRQPRQAPERLTRP